MHSEIQIEILGNVSIVARGQRHPVRANKVRTMLATLALSPGVAISHDELCDELWSTNTLGNSRNALQAHATRLRRLLQGPAATRGAGADLLRSVRNGYVLDVAPEAVDGNRFLDLAAQGGAAVAAHPERAVELLQRGLELWRGPALLDAGDGLRCRAAAALFDERRLTAWEDLVAARLAVGDERRAVPELRLLVGQHPLHERFCEQLMLALYRCGRQGEALELFHRTRRLLNAELGLEPGLPLQRRYSEILNHDPALAPAG
ncbi:AfsR/SARP family transcriptional regulator [Streptomonospora nanhaiensis]|uniref:DNA-binding SARP family transcriptional activator n=1 Tax=Streptomonospora nanhaiensis TaxID=1323731 RepID=A0A853BL84_9ACTN|nr:AfsR/SARP family transcriptional regulator [Streptomonospora nanhaiensis]NYI95282.1 DNA-binding SARP family transcriptional activator [Streptomonospora nanhaiensis]